MHIREAIEKLVNRIDLSEEETISVMNQIMTGEATPLQVASFLTALRMKGEKVQEITGAARVMRRRLAASGPKPILCSILLAQEGIRKGPLISQPRRPWSWRVRGSL